jgi:hypothetical protein
LNDRSIVADATGYHASFAFPALKDRAKLTPTLRVEQQTIRNSVDWTFIELNTLYS